MAHQCFQVTEVVKTRTPKVNRKVLSSSMKLILRTEKAKLKVKEMVMKMKVIEVVTNLTGMRVI